MILYHFATSPYARRVRLAMALKGLSAELRDARQVPTFAEDVRRLNPLGMVPVLVDGERVVLDSTAILHYLDRKVPSPPLWPEGLAGAEAFEIMALADGAQDVLIDLASRYDRLATDPQYPEVRRELVGRAQSALEMLAKKVEGRGLYLCGDSWSGADIALFTLVAWFEGLPVRALSFPLAKRVVELGWTLPPALTAWADPHRKRPDVASLG